MIRNKNISPMSGEYGVLAIAAAGALAVSAALAWGTGEVTNATYGKEKAQEYVQNNGYTNVELTDKDTIFVGVRGCGKDESVKYEFKAKSPAGNSVDIAVCKGLLKGATLREG